MRIGIDFDNTLVDYTGVFHQVALELNWIPESIGKSKAEVKAYFIEQNNEAKWTELQGLVYGKHILKAKPYNEAIAVIEQLQQAGHELFIVSHKTQYPFIGEQVDLHQAAKSWLKEYGVIAHGNEVGLLPESSVFFNQKKEQKLAKAAELQCDVFIDDLVEILTHELYPQDCQGVLFDPNNQPVDFAGTRVKNWQEFAACL